MNLVIEVYLILINLGFLFSGIIFSSLMVNIPSFISAFFTNISSESVNFLKKFLFEIPLCKKYWSFFWFFSSSLILDLTESSPSANWISISDLRSAVKDLNQDNSYPSNQMPSLGCNIKWTPGKEPSWFKWIKNFFTHRNMV